MGTKNEEAAFRKVGKAGRKLKLTEKLIGEICNTLRAGAYLETAAAVAGVSKDTLHTWLRKGRNAKGKKAGEVRESTIYGQLIIAVSKAVEECVIRDLAVIDAAANPKQNAVMLKNEKGEQLYGKDGETLFIRPQAPNWNAAAWRLERRHADRWSRTEKIQPLDAKPQATEEFLDTDKLKAAREKLEREF